MKFGGLMKSLTALLVFLSLFSLAQASEIVLRDGEYQTYSYLCGFTLVKIRESTDIVLEAIHNRKIDVECERAGKTFRLHKDPNVPNQYLTKNNRDRLVVLSDTSFALPNSDALYTLFR
jgi:hypothetical protein